MAPAYHKSESAVFMLDEKFGPSAVV